MGFRDLNLKLGYNSNFDDVVSEFFVPMLKEAILYQRVSAYYSSKSIKVMAEGLASMISNNGKMQLIVSYLINEDDFDAIKEAKTDPNSVLNKIFVENKTELESLMKEDNVAALAYLIANGRLEMKFALCKDEDSIFHLKFGIFKDANGDVISFSGSINETSRGLDKNVEEFKVFKGWIDNQKEYVDIDSKEFETYWGESLTALKHGIIITEMPPQAKEILIETYKKYGKPNPDALQPIVLRDVQKNALNSWIDNDRAGLLEMATGVGKTYIGAYACLDLIEKCKNEGLIIVIGCPTIALAKQWENRLSIFTFPKDCLRFLMHDTITKDDLYKMIRYGSKKKLIIIGTYKTIYQNWFINDILPDDNYQLALIADEAHWLGAKKLSAAMSDKYKYRLGLTATPFRNFDVEGTDQILKYFDRITYNYPIHKAIEDRILTQYYYRIYVGDLTNTELTDYIKLTKKYVRSSHRSSNDEVDLSKIILTQRAKIVKKARSKLTLFREIMEKLKNESKLKYLLVYCEDNNHIQEFKPILDEFGVESRIVRSGMEKQTSGIITDFEEGNIDCIIAMKIFDEGIDVKPARIGIFVSSTTNPKQFIQRRGRLLRTAINKDYAEIYDIIILPSSEDLDESLQKIETGIVTKEIKRVLAFSNDAKNSYECHKTIEKLCERRGINIWEMLKTIKKEGG